MTITRAELRLTMLDLNQSTKTVALLIAEALEDQAEFLRKELASPVAVPEPLKAGRVLGLLEWYLTTLESGASRPHASRSDGRQGEEPAELKRVGTIALALGACPHKVYLNLNPATQDRECPVYQAALADWNAAAHRREAQDEDLFRVRRGGKFLERVACSEHAGARYQWTCPRCWEARGHSPAWAKMYRAQKRSRTFEALAVYDHCLDWLARRFGECALEWRGFLPEDS